MFHKVKELKKYGIQATDGNIGTVHDFYIDDKHWTTRYLIVDTLKWLLGRKVLVSPMSIQQVNMTEGNVEVSLDKDKIKDGPDIDLDKPVSKQFELEFGSYYGYPPYWRGTGFWGPYFYPGELARVRKPNPAENENIADVDEIENKDESNLRSLKEVTEYNINAKDGELGHVEDFIIDDKTWSIRYIVIDTKNWWPGKQVIVSPDWITDVSWRENTVYVDLTKDEIKSAPEYIPDEVITREYENNLYDKYNKSKYWL
jgi:sporulation protein YlmC with PRC-barrel domain